MDAPEPDVTRQFLPMMMEQAKRMQSLVEDLLTLSRLENGSKTASQEKVDMAALLNTLRVEAEGLSQGRHQIILGDCDAANLWGNANELHSAFGNLVSNAVRYTRKAGASAWTGGWTRDAACSASATPASASPRNTSRA